MPQGRKSRTRVDKAKSDALFAWPIIALDQEPFRRNAAAECSRARVRLENARVAWHRFEREDKPAFHRWRAREFGPLLSKAREVELQIRECQALVHEVEMEMRRSFQDASSAYQRVIFRRENPTVAEEEPFNGLTNECGASRVLSDFEKEALFQEWIRRSLGTNPDKMDDDAYSTTFEAFKSHMFLRPRTEALPRNPYPPSGRFKESLEEDEGEVEATAPADARVKELYRRLVRRLHPDRRADGNASVSALWHEVQEAYAASDIARMEILLALSEIEFDHMSNETSLSQMRAVLVELERAWRALEKSVLEAQGEDAWNFARTGADDALRQSVQRQLQSDFAARSARLDLLTSTIACWAKGPAANRTGVAPSIFRGESRYPR